jgi:hypothetical protein
LHYHALLEPEDFLIGSHAGQSWNQNQIAIA